MNYKIAVFTDIHANIDALNIILSDANEECCDEMIHLGDAIAIGPEPCLTLDLLIKYNVTQIMGNHEQYYLKKGNDLPDYIKDSELEHQRWVYQEIGDQFLSHIAQLPYRIEREIGGKKIVFMHYPLNDNGITKEFKGFLKDISYHNVDDFFCETADIVMFGHFHSFIDIQSEVTGTRYIDPGAAGCSKTNMTRYTILTFNDEGYAVKHKCLKYDKMNMVNRLIQKNVPAADFIIPIFYGVCTN